MDIVFSDYGFNGEDNSRLITINVESALQNKRIWLEFQKPHGQKMVSDELSNDLNNGSIEYYLRSDLLDEIGNLKMQVIASEVGFVKKSKIYEYYVAKSINATEQIADETPSVFDKLGIIVNDGDGTNYLADDGTYKTVSGGVADYNDLTNQPIIIITSLDSANPVNLRSLASGLYRLHGYFKPYATFTGAFTVPTPLFSAVVNNGDTSYVQLYFAYNNMIQYFELTDENFTNTNVMLNSVLSQLSDLNDRVTALENQ